MSPPLIYKVALCNELYLLLKHFNAVSSSQIDVNAQELDYNFKYLHKMA